MRRKSTFLTALLVVFAALAILGSQAGQAEAGPNPIWGTPTPASTSAIAFAGNPKMEQDGLGNLHLIFDYCYNGSCSLFYTKRDTNGNWGSLESPPGQITWRYSESVLVSEDGTAHVFWEDQLGGLNSGFYYTQRSPAGTWSQPEERGYIGNRLSGYERDGYLYIVGDAFVVRAPDGTWATEPVPGYVFSFEIAPDGQQFLLYQSGFDLRLATRQAGGTWSAGELITTTQAGANWAKLVLDGSGNPRIVWRDDATYDCFPYTCNGYRLHYRESNSGTWSVQEDLALLKGNNFTYVTSDMAVADDGTRYVMWSSDEELKNQPSVFVSRRNGVNDWITPSVYPGYGVRLLTDQGTIHAFWKYQGSTLFHWIAYSNQGFWSYPSPVAYSSDSSLSYDVDPDLDRSGRLHLFWPDRPDVNVYRMMYRSWDAANVPTVVPTATPTVPAATSTPVPLNRRVFLPDLAK